MGVCVGAVWVTVVAVALVTIPALFQSGPPIYRGKGYAAPGWEPVIEAFRENLDSGLEKGGAYAVYYKGELVVDYAGGYADVEAEWHWSQDTLCQIFSSTKGVMAVVMAMLVDRGLLAYSEPVATYWPEFAANGKERITVEQLLSHQIRLNKDAQAMGLGWDLGCVLLLDPTTGGEQHGYHALTIGLYADEILKRVDPKHRDMKQFFKEEIAEKYGIDMHLGLENSEVYRTARIYGDTSTFFRWISNLIEALPLWRTMISMRWMADSLSYRAANNPAEVKFHDPRVFNNPESRRMTNPSISGFATAAGLAKFWSIVANRGQQGNTRLISEEMLDRMAEVQVIGFDQIILSNIAYGRGIIPVPALNHDGLAVGSPGAGGQMGYADPRLRLSWAYVTNHHGMMGDNSRYINLIAATYRVVDELQERTPTT